MTVPRYSDPVNGSDLGGPFDERLRLLREWQEAIDARNAAQVDGNAAKIAEAEWAVTEAHGRILSHEQDLADALLMSLRFAAKHRPAELLATLGELASHQLHGGR